MKVVIMAGGKGTRIASVRSDVPKPMIPIFDKPILEWQIESLKACGLTDITFVIGYLGHVIKEYFGDGEKFGVKISYFVEDSPLGTAGALFKMLDVHTETTYKNLRLDDDFLLLCGDVILDVDFNRFIEFHKKNHAWASLMAHPNDHPYDSSLLVTEILPPQVPGDNPVDTHRVVKWMAKEDERLYYKNRVNAGIEIISPELLKETMKHFVPHHPEIPDKIDLDRDVLKPNIPSGKIFAYDTPEYIKDMGTPDRYYEVEKDLQTGKVKARNLKNRQKAVFLNRDCTINKYVDLLTKPEQFELLPGAAEAIKKINKSGYLVIVIANRSVIARGDCTWEELQKFHDKMETELGKEGAFLDAIYICPHYKDKEFEGERLEYKLNCDCRKPKSCLIIQAAEDFNIDLSKSYTFGDCISDKKAGICLGCKKSILVDVPQGMDLIDIVSSII